MNPLPTSYALEQQAQQQWRRQPRYAHVDIFDRLVANEFLPEDRQRAWRDGQVALMARFAAEHVPYYRNLFKRLGLSLEDIRGVDDLAKLPVLSRTDVVDHVTELQADALPPGEAIAKWMHTSGTTGRPVHVLMTQSCAGTFGILAQRHYRWFRWNPQGKLATVRGYLKRPGSSGLQNIAPGEVVNASSWMSVGAFFQTGPLTAMSAVTDVEDQIAWLARERPNYLITYPGTLEAYCFACEKQGLVDSLRGFESVGALLSPAVRTRIEQSFGLPVEEAYGLAEVGIVATRCSADRYHVHSEHVVVEIVDDQGKPCAEGAVGHLVITTLRNAAMPLLRYDSTDLAEVATTPCPCGRTLPGFRRLVGRHRPNWPARTAARYFALFEILGKTPTELMRPLRQSQLHENRDHTYELRIMTRAPMPEAFATSVLTAWAKHFGDETPLSIIEVDHIPLGPGGKRQEFTSDLLP